jgi:hypothetical protein
MNLQPSTQKQEREYLHTVSAGAVLPFMQATGFALVIFIAVWVIVAVTFNAMDPHKPALLFAVIAWVAMLWRLFRHWLRLTMPVIEYVARDLADDGMLNNSAQPAAEEEPLKVIRIQIIKDNGHVSSDIPLPGDREALGLLARGLLNGMPFSESMWTGKGKPFSTKTFRALREVMRSNGLAQYVNDAEPKQGMRLTDEGRQVMETLASPTPPQVEEEP